MTSKAPPAPAENTSPKGTGETKSAPKGEGHAGKDFNPDKQGQAGDSKVNTHQSGLSAGPVRIDVNVEESAADDKKRGRPRRVP